MANQIAQLSLLFIVLNLFATLIYARIKLFWVRALAFGFIFSALIVTGFGLYYQYFDVDVTGPVNWALSWVQFDGTDYLKILLVTSKLNVMHWFGALLLLSLSELFCLIKRKDFSPGMRLSHSLMLLGAYFISMSGNLTTIFLGGTTISISIFLGLSLDSTNRSSEATRISAYAIKYFALAIFSDIVLVGGVLSVGWAMWTTPFSELGALTEGAKPVTLFALICGLLLKSAMLPLLSKAKYAAASTLYGPLYVIIGYLLLAPFTFYKLSPAFLHYESLFHFSLIPIVTSLMVSLMAPAEDKVQSLVLWFGMYSLSQALLAMILGVPVAMFFISFGSAIALSVLVYSIRSLGANTYARKVFLVIALLSQAGMPMTAAGQGKLLLFGELAQRALAGSALAIFDLSILVITEFLFILAILNFYKNEDLCAAEDDFEKAAQWEILLPLSIVSILTFSFVIGGRPFSGFLSEVETTSMYRTAWFESAIIAASNLQKVAGTNIPEVHAFEITLIIIIASMSSLVGLLWLLRDKSSIKTFKDKWKRIASYADSEAITQKVFWSGFVRRVVFFCSRVVARFDSSVITALSEFVATAILWVSKKIIAPTEVFVFEKVLPNFFEQGATKLGIAIKKMQTGKVQAYIAFALAVTFLAVIKHLIKLGG